MAKQWETKEGQQRTKSDANLRNNPGDQRWRWGNVEIGEDYLAFPCPAATAIVVYEIISCNLYEDEMGGYDKRGAELYWERSGNVFAPEGECQQQCVKSMQMPMQRMHQCTQTNAPKIYRHGIPNNKQWYLSGCLESLVDSWGNVGVFLHPCYSQPVSSDTGSYRSPISYVDQPLRVHQLSNLLLDGYHRPMALLEFIQAMYSLKIAWRIRVFSPN